MFCAGRVVPSNEGVRHMVRRDGAVLADNRAGKSKGRKGMASRDGAVLAVNSAGKSKGRGGGGEASWRASSHES